MPEVKITSHRSGHTQEHTFHLPYDPEGERVAAKLTRTLQKVTKVHRDRAYGAPKPVRARKVR